MSLSSETQPLAASEPGGDAGGAVALAKRPTDGIIAMAGLAFAAVALLAVGTLILLNNQQTKAAAMLGSEQQAGALAAALAPALEASLGQGDLNAARLLLTDSAIRQGVSQCRVVLPDGRVLAAVEPGVGLVSKLPSDWAAQPPPQQTQFAIVRPVVVNGRGTAYLQVAPAEPVAGGSEGWIATVVGLALAGVVSAMVAYRNARNDLGGLWAVREALLASAAGTSGTVVPLSPTLGAEAIAWNALVNDRERARKDTMADRAREMLGRRKQARGDLDAACDAMSQGLVLVDEAGRVKYANGAAATYLRTDREKLMAADLSQVIGVEKVIAAIRDVAGGSLRRRVVIDVERTPDAAVRQAAGDSVAGGVLRFSVRPVRREDAASAMIVIEDITQQRAAEAARHSFVAQATHELRTPLTNIRLYVETAIEDGESDPSIRTKALNVINGEARRLERIVGEMLSVAEIEAGAFKLKVDDVRLDQLFEELRHDYDEQAKDKQIALSFVLPPKWPVLMGDRDKVAIALHNLVGNALKYTTVGGSVTVRVDCDEKEVAVAVADTGIGIAPDECERVFERFFRSADGRVSKITGTGLGLTIAREAARLHGGDITLESQLNKGSTFTLTLPLKAA